MVLGRTVDLVSAVLWIREFGNAFFLDSNLLRSTPSLIRISDLSSVGVSAISAGSAFSLALSGGNLSVQNGRILQIYFPSDFNSVKFVYPFFIPYFVPSAGWISSKFFLFLSFCNVQPLPLGLKITSPTHSTSSTLTFFSSDTTGKAYVWGSNQNGNLGLGDTSDRYLFYGLLA